MTDVVADIIAAVDLSDYDLATAEGRRDLDNFLRRELQMIDDETLRSHAGQMIKDWRVGVLNLVPAPLCPICGAEPEIQGGDDVAPKYAFISCRTVFSLAGGNDQPCPMNAQGLEMWNHIANRIRIRWRGEAA